MHAHFAELERLGDEIAELSAHLDAATARLLDLLREFDARGGWEGARSCAEWLSWRVGLDLGAARERVRVARVLGGLPLLAAALARGELSYSKVRALTRVATPETEARLLAVGRAGTAAHVERIVRGWRYVDRQVEAKEAKARHRARTLQVYTDEDGMVVVRGRLGPEAGAVLVRALEAARATLYQPGRTVGDASQGPVGRRADRRAAAGGRPGAGRGDGPGAGVRRRPAERALPGGSSRGRGGAGGTRRAGPVGPRRRHARFCRNVPPPGVRGDPGGDAPRGRWVGARRGAADADDPAGAPAGAGGAGPRLSLSGVRRAARPGPSHSPLGQRRADPAPESRASVWRHHRAVHEEGYTVVRDADGTLRFGTPGGWAIPETPAPPAVPRDPAQALVATNRAHGVGIGPRTAIPHWCGERLDLGWAIDVLHPACQPSARQSFVETAALEREVFGVGPKIWWR